ncbi:MAG TPA: hypothetical protein VMF52_11060 [Steroidobacteraceae bacterium]|nr:hypothetical protein [Steroidobacteraceae bacterium]
MNKLVATFATTTALFATSTAWLAWRVNGLEAGAPAGPSGAVVESPPATASPASGGTVAASPVALAKPGATTGNLAATATPATPPDTDAGRAMTIAFGRDFLKQYDSPATRATLVANTRGGIEAQYARFRDRYKIDARTFDQLVGLLAEEQLEQQANYFRCLVDPACDTSKITQPRDRSDELTALLGGRVGELRAFQSSLPEWQSIVQLRGRLPESSYLRDPEAERLLSALSGERERFRAEAGQSGSALRGWGNGTGMLWYSGDGGIAEQMASANAYAERLRGQAADILTPEQLAAFIQLQQEMLAGLESYLRSTGGKPG